MASPSQIFIIKANNDIVPFSVEKLWRSLCNAGAGKLQSVEHPTETNNHHEYREQSLPAYAVSFDDARRSTVYVAAELGTVQKIRNRHWRRFDFLWMLRTMYYSSRDNIMNWLLRVFFIFGLAMVASGFTLFFVSRKRKTRT